MNKIDRPRSMCPPDFYDDVTHIEGTNGYANEAGLKWWAEQQAKRDPKAATRCFWGPGWQCPFMLKGEGMPCLKPKQHKKDVVEIGFIYWVEEHEPIGQMSLFAPRVTHRLVRKHYQKGTPVSDDAQPLIYQASCRQFAVAFIKWWEKEDILRPPGWRIMPVGGKSTKLHDAWAGEQVKKHRTMKACIFEGDGI